MPSQIKIAGVVLERPEGGYIAADVVDEYKNLKDIAGLLLADLGVAVLRALDAAINSDALETAIETVIESLPQPLQASAWDAWINVDRDLL